MADTNTTVLDLLLMEIDSHENDWGDQTNANLAIIARAIGATVSHAVTTGTVVLTRNNVKDAFHRITGVLVGNVVIEVPALEPKTYFWKNETTGAFTVTIKVTGQTGVAISQGDTKLLRCNGTDVVDCGLASAIGAGGVASWVGTFSFAADAYSTAANNFLGATLYDGLTVTGFFDDANATTTPTYNYAATGAKIIVHADGTALAIGEIVDGAVGSLTYKTSTNKWYLQSPPASKFARLGAANTFAATFLQTFAGRTLNGLETLADGATIAWDMAARPNDVKIVLTATRILGLPTNIVTGQEGTLLIMQDAIGGWSLTLNAIFKQSGMTQTILDIDKTANSRTRFHYKVVETSAAVKEIQLTRMWSEGKDSLGFWKEYALGSYSLNFNTSTTHGLGRLPALVQLYMALTTSEFGYTAGERLDCAMSLADSDTAGRQIAIVLTTSVVKVRAESNNAFIQRFDLFGQVGIGSLSTAPTLHLRVYE